MTIDLLPKLLLRALAFEVMLSLLLISLILVADSNVSNSPSPGTLNQLPEVVAPGVPDFAMTGSNLTVYQGNWAKSSILFSSLNGFTGTIQLAYSPGITAGLDSFTVNLAQGGSSTVVVSVSSENWTTPAPGTYLVVIYGTSGSLHHSLSIYVTVMETGYCVLSASQGSITIRAGDTNTTTTVTVTPKSGFSSQVHLYAEFLPFRPNEPTATFSPDVVQGSGVSRLTISTTGATSPGNYTIVVGECDTSPLVTVGPDPFTSIQLRIIPPIDQVARVYGVPVTTLLAASAITVSSTVAIVTIALRQRKNGPDTETQGENGAIS